MDRAGVFPAQARSSWRQTCPDLGAFSLFWPFPCQWCDSRQHVAPLLTLHNHLSFRQVYESVDEATRFWIKGRRFSVAGLLADASPERELSAPHARGTLAIFRLAPQDYHRFHAPLGGSVVSITPVPGELFTVNPIAIHSEFVDVFTENKRSILWLDTPEFGRVAFVAVGATLVGSIVWSVGPGDAVAKGQELGYFAFGGSTCILLLPDAHPVVWDEDLLQYGWGELGVEEGWRGGGVGGRRRSKG